MRLALRTVYQDALRPLGRTVAQAGVMHAIERFPGASIVQLAHARVVTPQSVAEHVAVLESAGLVTRERPTGRGHVIALYLSDAGVHALNQCYAAMATAEAQLWEDIPPEDQQHFRRLLERHLAPFTVAASGCPPEDTHP